MRRTAAVLFAFAALAVPVAAPLAAQPIAEASALSAPRRASSLLRPVMLRAGEIEHPRQDGSAGGTGRTLLFSTAGAIVGALAGGTLGASLASGELPCRTADPDGCLGAQLPRALWGAGIGITTVTPLGAHLGNRRRGKLAYTILTSTALFAGELIALHALVEDGRTQHKSTVFGIAVGMPVLQIVATTLVERATTR